MNGKATFTLLFQSYIVELINVNVPILVVINIYVQRLLDYVVIIAARFWKLDKMFDSVFPCVCSAETGLACFLLCRYEGQKNELRGYEIPASVKNACRLFSCLLWEGAGGGNVREQDAHLVWSNKSPRAHGSPWQGEHATTVTKTLLATSTSPIMHLICPPKILHNLCFSFLLGITAVPWEIENSVYAKFGGQIRCIMGDV